MNTTISNPITKFFRVLWVLGFMSSLSSFSQNAPITVAPAVLADAGTTINVPVIVTGFDSIGAVSLSLTYDTSVLVFQTSAANPAFPGLSLNTSEPGKIIIGGFGSSNAGISLADNSDLFTIVFIFQGGSTELAWTDNGSSCEYSGPAPDFISLNDDPQASYYINGSVNTFPFPGSAGPISGPLEGEVCEGETGVLFSVQPIVNATDYTWSLPQGATITSGNNTSEITVSFSTNAGNGSVTVFGSNTYGTGAFSPPFPIMVNTAPEILEQPVSPASVNAGSGIALLNVSSTGSGLNFRWQEFVTVWLDISDAGVYSGSTTESLMIKNPPFAMNGNRYRCMISGRCEPMAVTDGNAELTVTEMLGKANESVLGNNNVEISIFPNPCTEKATLGFTLSETCEVTLVISNMLGETIQKLVSLPVQPGYTEWVINTAQFAPGMYKASLIINKKNNLSESAVKLIKYQ